MKKIFFLATLLASMATATFAATGGGFTWTGQGATYDSNLKALILENANLSQLTVATSSNDESNYGTTYKIIVRGTCAVTPTSKLNGITFGHTNFDYAPTLTIVGEGENPTLTLDGQDKAGIYMATNGYLDLKNIHLTCNGKLQTAQYGICGYSSTKDFSLIMRTNVVLTLNGKTSQWNYLYSIRTPETSVSLIDPAGATLNQAYGNNFIILNGENYNGKATLATGSGIIIGGVEVDYSNGDNFTNTVTAGKVSFTNGKLRLENATITGEIVSNRDYMSIELVGTNTVQNNATFINVNLYGDENAKLNINGRVMLRAEMYIYNEVQFRNVSNEYTMVGKLSGDEPYVTVANGSFYAEGTNVIAKSKVRTIYAGYVIEEGTTAAGKKYIYAREIKNYGITLYKNNDQSYVVTNENYTDPLGDGSVSFDPDSKQLTLRNAELQCLMAEMDLLDIHLERTNRIIHTGYNAAAIVANVSELNISGSGSLDLASRNNLSALALDGNNTQVYIANTTLNISASWYAIIGNNMGREASVEIENSNVTLQSGASGVISNVNSFTLNRAEFTAPADAMFFDGQLCANYQPIAANTKVEIKALAEGIENVELTGEASKVLIDGVIYIVRDNKLFDLQGAQVR